MVDWLDVIKANSSNLNIGTMFQTGFNGIARLVSGDAPKSASVEDVADWGKDNVEATTTIETPTAKLEKPITTTLSTTIITGVQDAASNAVKAVEGLGSDVLTTVKKYAPYALLGVGAVVALKLSKK